MHDLLATHSGIEKDLNWILNMITLLCDVKTLLSKFVLEWERFENSDIGYFSDNYLPATSGERTHLSLKAVMDTFSELSVLERDFDHWEKYCQSQGQAVRHLESCLNYV